ncbi:hypothetical protein [Actinoplanes sp. NPDC051859]|uniref:hypothetical protein n=1 Tax=Actinoplanes sp. NPDC051859 TaxID=3363909 RepID=UPI0037964E2D
MTAAMILTAPGAVPAAASSKMLGADTPAAYNTPTDHAFYFRNSYTSTVSVSVLKDDSTGACTTGVRYPSVAQSTKAAATYVAVSPGQVIPLVEVFDASCRVKTNTWMVDVKGPGTNASTKAWGSGYLIGRFWFFGDGRVNGQTNALATTKAPWDKAATTAKKLDALSSDTLTTWRYSLSGNSSLPANGSFATLHGIATTTSSDTDFSFGAAASPARSSTDAHALTVTSLAANIDSRLLDDWCDRAKHLQTVLSSVNTDVLLLQGLNMRSAAASCATDAVDLVAKLWTNATDDSLITSPTTEAGAYVQATSGTGTSPQQSGPFPYVSQLAGGLPVQDQPATTGGAVILSKYPLTMLANSTFTNQSTAGDERGFVMASIVKNGTRYVVINAGMDPSGNGSRVSQLDQIARAVKTNVPDGVRLILGGSLGATLGSSFASKTATQTAPTNYDPSQLGLYSGSAGSAEAYVASAQASATYPYSANSSSNFYQTSGTAAQTSFIAPLRTLPKTSAGPYTTADFTSSRYEAPVTYQWWNHPVTYADFKYGDLSSEYAVTAKFTFSTTPWSWSVRDPVSNELLKTITTGIINTWNHCSSVLDLGAHRTVRRWSAEATGADAGNALTGTFQVSSDNVTWTTVDSSSGSGLVGDTKISDRVIDSVYTRYTRYCSATTSTKVTFRVYGTVLALRGHFAYYPASKVRSSTSAYVEDVNDPARVSLDWNSSGAGDCSIYRRNAAGQVTEVKVLTVTECATGNKVLDSLPSWRGLRYSYMFCKLAKSCTDWINVSDPRTPAISSASDHTCMMTSSTSTGAACWGADDYSVTTIPASVSSVKAISAGSEHTCAIDSMGKLTCWGSSRLDNYKRADGTTSPMSRPPTMTVSSVSVGSSHACAIRVDNEQVQCWGPMHTTPPASLGAVLQVSVGSRSACAVTKVYELTCWGDSTGKTVSDAPKNVSFYSVSVSSTHACGVSIDSAAICWGSGLFSTSPDVADEVSLVSTVAVGYYVSCAREFDDSVSCAGNFLIPAAPSPSSRFTAVAAGRLHACGIQTSGVPVCWGSGTKQLAIPASLTK